MINNINKALFFTFQIQVPKEEEEEKRNLFTKLEQEKAYF